MKLLILGATGRTGRLVTEKALSRGHHVTAFVRTPSLQITERLAIAVGDPRRIDDLLAVLPGHDAVVSCLGNATAPADRRLVTNSASAMLTAIKTLNVRRYVVQSGALLFPSLNPVIWALQLGMASKLADARAMEHVVRASDIDWTIVRPPQLKHGVDADGYRAKAGGRPTRKWSPMKFTDLADFLLDAVERRQFIRQIVGVASA
jgi:putative NADH-flavin reductase